ncbi:U11/U12 small nuclear ribonucleoprotein 25 kDa protein-like isoform X1 [Rhodnius prolixus]|uniref:Ubiquitin_4 domain-containing protein n=3 Tax=Rhodnius TaxID=13248 RepID=T1H7X7_RHOPR
MENYKDPENDEDVKFVHSELVEITTKTVCDLIEGDSLLKDLPRDVTLEEVTSMLALQHGQSMKVYIYKDNGECLPIVVGLGATVLDLKRAVRRHITLMLERQGETRCLSWRYVWRNNYLSYNGHLLDNDSTALSEYGICNKVKLHFVKRFRTKSSIKHSH